MMRGLDSKVLVCTVCGATPTAFGPGPSGRPNAACPKCGSLERHRVLALLLGVLVTNRPQGTLILDVAPSPILSRRIRELSDGNYCSVDFDPAADRRTVDLQASLTELPLKSRSVGLLICSHVLEHIPDDHAAMRQISMALHQEGVAFLQVPRRRGRPTDEEVDASADERIIRFGQSDHVRYYGDDFEERLRAAGLLVFQATSSDVLSRDVLAVIGANQAEEMWFATTIGDPESALDLDQRTAAVIRGLRPLGDLHDGGFNTIGEIAEATVAIAQLSSQRDIAQAESANWKNEYLWLRNKPIIRFGLAAKASIRKLARSVGGSR